MISKPNFQTVNKKRVHRETYKRFWDNFPPNFTKKFIFQNRKIISPFTLHLFYILKTANTIGSLRNYGPWKHYHLFTPQNFPGGPLTIPRECILSTDSAHTDLDCTLTTVAECRVHVCQ